MKFQYLGTAAAEGIPALACVCSDCVKSRKIGGRAIRTRSQAIIDDSLLIDYGPDTVCHTYTHNIDLSAVRECLITHSHTDHLYPENIDMLMPGYAALPDGYHVTFYGSEAVGSVIKPRIEGVLTDRGYVSFRQVEAFKPISVGKYTVTPLPAIHSVSSGPVFYQITDGDKTVLYGHDTGVFGDEVWEFFEKTKPYFDLVSLDCTFAAREERIGKGHMKLSDNVEIRNKMLSLGVADDNTVFVCNHFSHNGTKVVYDDYVPIALENGFVTSYDGMIVEI